MKRLGLASLLFGVCLTAMQSAVFAADPFRIAIMQDQQGAAQKFKPLIDYLGKKGIPASFVSARDYFSAASMFSAGKVDAMFSGSGIAGSMIIKELALPEVRPVAKNGESTYWAVILAPKGTPKFTDSTDYFKGKKVIFTNLASAGEFYFRSLPSTATAGATLLKAASHGAAIEALEKGEAEFAVVKNRVWDKVKGKYPNLEMVGEDNGQNPDGTLIVSKSTQRDLVEQVTNALLAVKDDPSPEAQAVKTSLEIQGYITTRLEDFAHTLKMLKSAGVTKDFKFTF